MSEFNQFKIGISFANIKRQNIRPCLLRLNKRRTKSGEKCVESFKKNFNLNSYENCKRNRNIHQRKKDSPNQGWLIAKFTEEYRAQHMDPLCIKVFSKSQMSLSTFAICKLSLVNSFCVSSVVCYNYKLISVTS